MTNNKIKTVSEIIEALESFRRHYGPDAPVELFSMNENAEVMTVPICNVVEVDEESSYFWGEVTEPTLLIW